MAGGNWAYAFQNLRFAADFIERFRPRRGNVVFQFLEEEVQPASLRIFLDLAVPSLCSPCFHPP